MCHSGHQPLAPAKLTLLTLPTARQFQSSDTEQHQPRPGQGQRDLKMSRSVQAAGRCSHKRKEEKEKKRKERKTKEKKIKEKKRKENRIHGPFDPKVDVHVIGEKEKKQALNQQHMFIISKKSRDESSPDVPSINFPEILSRGFFVLTR